jgi:hypothetical protein
MGTAVYFRSPQYTIPLFFVVRKMLFCWFSKFVSSLNAIPLPLSQFGKNYKVKNVFLVVLKTKHSSFTSYKRTTFHTWFCPWFLKNIFIHNIWGKFVPNLLLLSMKSTCFLLYDTQHEKFLFIFVFMHILRHVLIVISLMESKKVGN